MTDVEQAADGLRRRLADQLAADGSLRSPQWRATVERVPRHVFLPEFFRIQVTDKDTLWEPVTRDTLGDTAWLELAYENTTWVTQLDRHIRPHDVAVPVSGDPTSSSTLPGLVVRMLEDLLVEDGQEVLEIGTGTGYSAALLCERLGENHVTSVEVDPGVAADAAAALTRAGYAPTLVVGDGLAGYAQRAPYDRIIATCSLRRVPAAWLHQTRPGGIILVTLGGWLFGFGLARLEVTGAGTARGRFLPGTVSFMLARSEAIPPLGARTPDWVLREGERRRAVIQPDEVFDDWTATFVAQGAAPGAQRLGIAVDGGPMTDYLIDVESRSVAALTPDPAGGYAVCQSGPLALWDDIENAIVAWRRVGAPGIDAFRIHADHDDQMISLDGGDGRLSWRLPPARRWHGGSDGASWRL